MTIVVVGMDFECLSCVFFCCLIKAKTNHNVDMTLHTLLLFALRLILIESDTSKNRLKRDDGRYRMVCSFFSHQPLLRSRDSIESFVLFMVEASKSNTKQSRSMEEAMKNSLCGSTYLSSVVFCCSSFLLNNISTRVSRVAFNSPDET